MLEEFLQRKAKIMNYQLIISDPAYIDTYSRDMDFVRQAPNERSPAKVCSSRITRQVLYFLHSSSFVRHPKYRSMHAAMKHHFSWLQMAKSTEKTVKTFSHASRTDLKRKMNVSVNVSQLLDHLNLCPNISQNHSRNQYRIIIYVDISRESFPKHWNFSIDTSWDYIPRPLVTTVYHFEPRFEWQWPHSASIPWVSLGRF